METPETTTRESRSGEGAVRYIVDYVRCDDLRQLKEFIEVLNRYQYQLVSVAQDSNDIFTVFFRRCLVG